MRKRIGGALLLLGGLITAFVGFIWWLRATADVGRPHPTFYVLTIVGPLMVISSAFALRGGRDQARSTAEGSRYPIQMRRPLRLALVVLGLGLAVYGTASLTSGWLGTPPWWPWRAVSLKEIEGAGWSQQELAYLALGDSTAPRAGRIHPIPPERQAKVDELILGRVQHDNWASWPGIIVIAVGVGLASLGAWPRHRRVSVQP